MPRSQPRPVFALPWTVSLILALAPMAVGAAEDRDGEAIYRQTCAGCHGASGEGNEDEYPMPLEGEKSVAQLARLIAKTMPADDPGTCTGEDAEKVAAFIFDEFYSPEARARKHPPRIELARLTVGQYRNALADLIGTFREAAQPIEKRGLKGEYFKSRNVRGRDRLIERVDPEVRFDFGTEGPEPEKFDPNVFSIRWEGSVLAPESGDYEFIVRTEHAARLWVNDPKRPLIDAWVKSGDDTEHRGSITLLGGRAYPIRLEFSKAKQGVDDSKTNKKEKPAVKASIALLWQRPKRRAEVIPERNLTPARSSETYVVHAAFPPDDRSVGFERGNSVSRAWDESTTEAAIEAADYINAHLKELAGTTADAPDAKEKLRDFSRRFVTRTFRRPLESEQEDRYIDRQFAHAPDAESAIKRVVLLALKSPRFLYREIGGGRDPYDVASRISFGLWDSLPDKELLDAAAANQLATREQVTRQADRMLPDLRTRAKVRDFFLRWLKVESVPDLAKDPKLFPEFDAAVIEDLRTSLELTLDDLVWGPDPDFRRLLTGVELFLNGRLSRFYGGDLPEDAPFLKVKLEPETRAGIVAHPYLLATFAYTGTTSPIHRGVFLARSVLGRTLRPPIDAFSPLSPDLHPDLTTRERVALQTRSKACMQCHDLINPLGFTLENFDAVGRYRSEEKGKPIDATGGYATRKGPSAQFAGARDLARFLASSDEVHDAFIAQLFHHTVKQSILAFGPGMTATLRRSFVAHQDNIRTLLVEIIAEAALTPRGSAPQMDASRPVRELPEDPFVGGGHPTD